MIMKCGLYIMVKSMDIKSKSKLLAFTLVESLINLFVTLIVGFLLFGVINQLFHYYNTMQNDQFIKWVTATMQIDHRLMWSEAKYYQVEKSKLYFKANDKDYMLRQYSNQLVESKDEFGSPKGYKPLLFGMYNIRFQEKKNGILMEVEMQRGQIYQYVYKMEKDTR